MQSNRLTTKINNYGLTTQKEKPTRQVATTTLTHLVRCVFHQYLEAQPQMDHPLNLRR